MTPLWKRLGVVRLLMCSRRPAMRQGVKQSASRALCDFEADTLRCLPPVVCLREKSSTQNARGGQQGDAFQHCDHLEREKGRPAGDALATCQFVVACCLQQNISTMRSEPAREVSGRRNARKIPTNLAVQAARNMISFNTVINACEKRKLWAERIGTLGWQCGLSGT